MAWQRSGNDVVLNSDLTPFRIVFMLAGVVRAELAPGERSEFDGAGHGPGSAAKSARHWARTAGP
jgi:hypothetical protein